MATSNVSEEQRFNAAEGKLITTESGRQYVLGVAATHDSLPDKLDAARAEAGAPQACAATLPR